ncbi:MAG: hypothetical protein ABW185_19365, partial [Sedimenticola sp.]
MELPASAQAKFNQATQTKTEPIEDWADRVLTMATRAFADLPEFYSNQQAISRFCQGLHDSMAGHHVCMAKSATMEEAMDEVRIYQHTRQATFGKDWRSREIAMSAENYEDRSQVFAVQYGRQAAPTPTQTESSQV